MTRIAHAWQIAGLCILPCIADDAVEIPMPHATGVALAAVLTLPPDENPDHAILLLPPAGPANPDLSLGPRGIYRAVAEELAEQGIASLRVSSRGIPPATGHWQQTSFADRALDATAAYDWLRTRPELENAVIAVAGTSEGGALATAVASRRASVAGVVMLSTPMRNGLTTMRWQRNRLLKGSTLTGPERELVVNESDRMLDGVLAADRGAVRAVLARPAGALVLPAYGMVPTDLEDRVDFTLSPWYRSQVGYEVESLVTTIRVPVFAAYGEMDWVIDAPRSAELLRSRLRSKVEADIRILPAHNHLMMPAVTGSPAEYAQLPELIDAQLWREIGDWLRKLTNERPLPR